MKKAIKTSQYDVMRQLRLPLIILVTYAHSYGAIQEGYNLLENGWDSYELLRILVSQTLVKVAVPTFYVMSGYLFFSNIEKFTKEVYWHKIKRRIKTLLIPYIIWNLLMAAKLRTISIGTFITPANMPLWFLRDLIIVSMLTPVIYIGVKKLGWWLVGILITLYLTGIWGIQPGPNPYAICFFSLGAMLSIKKVDLVETCGRFTKQACVLSVLLGIAMIITYGTDAYMLLMLCFRVTSAGALFGLVGKSNRNQALCDRVANTSTSQKCQVSLCHLYAKAAYFVYLAHYVLFFAFIDKGFFYVLGGATASLCLHYLVCPLIKAVILVGIYCVYNRIIHKICCKMEK